jgi:hypothetical protein
MSLCVNYAAYKHFFYNHKDQAFTVAVELCIFPPIWRQLHIFTSVPNITKGKAINPECVISTMTLELVFKLYYYYYFLGASLHADKVILGDD